jgi:hypothetical protein
MGEEGGGLMGIPSSLTPPARPPQRRLLGGRAGASALGWVWGSVERVPRAGCGVSRASASGWVWGGRDRGSVAVKNCVLWSTFHAPAPASPLPPPAPPLPPPAAPAGARSTRLLTRPPTARLSGRCSVGMAEMAGDLISSLLEGTDNER